MELKREAIDAKCRGCTNTLNWNGFYYCKTYQHPEAMWTRLGGCPLRIHNKATKVEDGKVLNALKASKRRAQGRL